MNKGAPAVQDEESVHESLFELSEHNYDGGNGKDAIQNNGKGKSSKEKLNSS